MMSSGRSCVGTSAGKESATSGAAISATGTSETHDTVKDATTLFVTQFGYGIRCGISAEAWISCPSKDHTCQYDQTYIAARHRSPLFRS